TSSIYDPIVGVQFTNTPTTYRRSFGTYTLSDITEPNWLVELYVNNVLVDYMKADASGFYKFEVPLVYGNSAVKLRFYGLWGEERIKEENISIPFNFLPPKELEYTMSAGFVEDSVGSRFSRGSFNYGVSRRLTVGGGVEYLSSIETGNAMPFVSSSLRLLSGLLVTGEYTYGVRAKGMLSYRLPSNLQFEINYTKYVPGQQAIIYNYLEERKATISIPIKGKNFSAYSRFSFNQIVLPNLKNTNAEMLWSGSIYGVSTNFTTYGIFTDLGKPYVYSNLSLAFRLPSRIALTPQAQYDYNNKELIAVKTNLEKPLFKKGFLSMSFEQNFRSNTRSFEVGFRYDLSFAQTGFSIRNTNNQNTLVESARGSLLVDRKSRYLGTNNRTSVGKGALSILPFLDTNGNGRHDRGEQKIGGLQFRINGGTIVRNDKDTTIRVLDLTPYTSYLLELDKNSFDNISWQMHALTMKVMVDPNQFKNIEVPISVMGEASGTVYNGSKGQGRILVAFYLNDTTLVGRTLTESDGYYSYLGLKPGKYTVRIDREQLKKINMKAYPEKMPVTFTKSVDGDMIDGLDFVLSPDQEEQPDSIKNTSQIEPVEPAADHPIQQSVEKTKAEKKIIGDAKSPDIQQAAPGIKPAAPDNKPAELTNKKALLIEDLSETLYLGAFKSKANAFALYKKVGGLTGKPAKIVYGKDYYYVQLTGLANAAQARDLDSKLHKSGIETSYIPGNNHKVWIQLGEYEKEEEAVNAYHKSIDYITQPVNIKYENNLYQVFITGFATREAASVFAAEALK
ncbi:MAG TPA: SPOR domain-containing protein, partial [Prolixibacteraceae bacterium]